MSIVTLGEHDSYYKSFRIDIYNHGKIDQRDAVNFTFCEAVFAGVNPLTWQAGMILCNTYQTPIQLGRSCETYGTIV